MSQSETHGLKVSLSILSICSVMSSISYFLWWIAMKANLISIFNLMFALLLSQILISKVSGYDISIPYDVINFSEQLYVSMLKASFIFSCQIFCFLGIIVDRSSGRDEKYSVDSIICPFNLQGTCRDETCEYKHLPN